MVGWYIYTFSIFINNIRVKDLPGWIPGSPNNSA